MTESLDQQLLCRADHSMNTIVGAISLDLHPFQSIPSISRHGGTPSAFGGQFHFIELFFSEKQMRLKMFLLRHILWKKRHGRPASVTNLSGRSFNSSNGDFGPGKVPFCFENSLVQRLSRGRYKMSPCWKCCVF